MSVTTICSVCHEKMNLDGWVDQFLDQYNNLSQAYCPECYRQITAKMQTGKGKPRPRFMWLLNLGSTAKNIETSM